jgi:hypothetical protein
MSRLEPMFVGIVFSHLAVVLAHSMAHAGLQVVPDTANAVFIVSVIMVAPVATLPILWFHRLAAAVLLAVTMVASLAYGLEGHFLAPGPDRVALVESNPWAFLFVATAALLGTLELVAVFVAAFLFQEEVRIPSGPSEPSP